MNHLLLYESFKEDTGFKEAIVKWFETKDYVLYRNFEPRKQIGKIIKVDAKHDSRYIGGGDVEDMMEEIVNGIKSKNRVPADLQPVFCVIDSPRTGFGKTYTMIPESPSYEFQSSQIEDLGYATATANLKEGPLVGADGEPMDLETAADSYRPPFAWKAKSSKMEVISFCNTYWLIEGMLDKKALLELVP